MLEDKIAALTIAIETLTKVLIAQSTKAPKTTKSEAPKVESEAPKVEPEAPKVEPEAPKAPKAKSKTLQDVREVAQKCLDSDKLEGVVAINKKYGLRKIGQATEDQLDQLHTDLTALLNG
jgi:hypothetical protein